MRVESGHEHANHEWNHRPEEVKIGGLLLQLFLLLQPLLLLQSLLLHLVHTLLQLNKLFLTLLFAPLLAPYPSQMCTALHILQLCF